ncbi:MAG: cytochrome C oxidase subunit I [Anaerolineae bacterium]|jgi:cytochrome c oxidase subunit I|nr:cytochrome C oxidase subunit I [Anaerolineae bacterium]MBT7070343.1 cytochrome C oxidase subunit I [Anaerolineae bacterium]MBT7324385.1 cytochrome C oxidase subunit I [Anaerolineae bacterium]
MNEKKKVNFLTLGLVRGIIFQVVGALLGMGFTMLIRILIGLPAWNAEPVWVSGMFVGVIAFLIGVGAFSDWFKWAKGEETSDHHSADPSLPGWAKYYSISFDHKVIGIQYGITSILVLGLAGTFALIFRTELAAAKMQFLDLGTFNSLIGLHGIVMIAAILLGIGAMSNYLVPLMIGASDMAFPRLNAFAFWINVPGALLVVSSLFFGGFDTGWTAYPPLSARAPLGMQMFFLGVYVIGLSSILGSLNIIVTTIRMRAPGMNYFRMPIFVWASVATSIIGLTATQFIALSFQMVMFQRLLGMGFFDPGNGGNVILFQHLFWFYSHPAVYVFILPGLGMISEILPVFSRKPLFGYKWIALSSMAIALVGFFVWAHHMFTSGMAEYLRVPFMYSTMLVAVPTGVKFFSWTGTLWRGKISFPTPMLFTLGAISVFLLGGLTGPPNATVATDLHLHDTYWIVGHFHATMFGGFMFPFFAAIYYWFPKITGKMYNEAAGKWHFWLMFPAFYVQSLGQMRIGLLGMRRRIADYDPALNFDFSHLIITIAGFVIFTSVVIFVVNIWRSVKRGEVAASNPWNSRSPEWLLPTPIPEHNYADHPFEVVGEPYDYGLEDAPYIKMPSASATD